ncbi:MAG: hypothetical protein ACXABY_04025 [Candidatus Thorarchaeota archaeon]|jgi:hypothetical protein
MKEHGTRGKGREREAVSMRAAFPMILLIVCLLAVFGFRYGLMGAVTTDFGHSNVHQGRSFVAGVVNASMGSGNKEIVLINVPSTTRDGVTGHSTHFRANFSSAGKFHAEIWEGATVSNVGTALTEYNRARWGGNPDTEMSRYPVITSIGNHLTGFDEYFFGSKNYGTDVDFGNEIILKTNTLYILNAVSDTASNGMQIGLNWYETWEGF